MSRKNCIYIFDLDDTITDTTGWKEVSSVEDDYHRLKLKALPNAAHVLASLAGPKILVTAGVHETQQQKVFVMGLKQIPGFPDFFSEIHYVPTAEAKEDTFRGISKKYREKGIWGSHVVVIGNRIDREIYYGNLLGFTTVRILHGSYARMRPANTFEHPHYTIRNLSDLLDLPCIDHQLL
jgi:FMN phosphatase YigB (HAD superfamily)